MALERRIELRQVVDIIAMFLVVQLGGLLIASLVFTTSPIAHSSASIQTSSIDALGYVVYIIAVALVLLLVIRFYNGELLFKAIEAVVVVLPSFIVFTIVLGYLAPASFTNYNIIYAIALILAVSLIVIKNLRPGFRNVITIIASIGVGVVLGLDFSFYEALLFMAFIAIYDYIAVFVTKHMVTMAKAISSRNLAFLIGTSDIEAVPASYFTKKELDEYRKEIKESNAGKNPLVKKIMNGGRIPVMSQIQLGAGDLGLPLMLTVSAFPQFLNYTASLVIVVGATVGMAFTMFFLKKYQRPLPAIPPLFAFICIALGTYLLLLNLSNALFSLLLIAVGVLTVMFGIVFTLKNEAEKKNASRGLNSSNR